MSAAVFHHDEPVMGTVVSFDIYASSLSHASDVLALSAARKTLRRVDAVFSTYREHSPMSRLRRGEITIDRAPPEIAEVLEICAIVRDLTDGWFDPWALAGGVDPTGLVKGWSAERALRDLVAAGIEIASINAGGDIVTVGSPNGSDPWRFGIQDPFQSDRLAAIVNVDRAVATSGLYARGSHLIDPHSRRAAPGVASATVIGEDLTIADGLATALGIAGAPLLNLISRAGYAGFVITHQGERFATPGFPFASNDLGSTTAAGLPIDVPVDPSVNQSADPPGPSL